VRKPRVLVVEDSPPNRKLLLSLLRLLRVDPVGAENGQVCVDLFADTVAHGAPMPFDLVLIDGSMPVLSGLEATTILRKQGIRIPIIAVTGNALAEDVQAFLQAGADAVLLKPTGRQALVQALRKYLPPELAAQIPSKP
jgi:CheY-like chemotaxis protein